MDSSVLNHYLTREKLTWNHHLYDILLFYFRDRLEFELKEVFKVSSGALSYYYPNNNTINYSIMRTLQNLRDDGKICFIRRGVYGWGDNKNT
tara:strand:+ start:2013 stop:2288 length:276 start_codon:yes stop_codon:yes gene_type:complete